MRKSLCGAAAALGAALVCVCAYTLNAQNYAPAATAPLAAKLAEGVTALMAPSVSPVQNSAGSDSSASPVSPSSGALSPSAQTPAASDKNTAASAVTPPPPSETLAPSSASLPDDNPPASTPSVEVMGETTPKPDSGASDSTGSAPSDTSTPPASSDSSSAPSASGDSSAPDSSSSASDSSGTGSESMPPMPPESQKPEELPVRSLRDPLTGMPLTAALTTRPVAVMIDNIQGALPQRGLQSAGLVYESVTEGGVTRLTAVYADAASMPQAGPVCAARDQFIQLLLPLDAVCMHVGASEYADALWTQYDRASASLDGAVQPALLLLDDARKASMNIEYCWFTSGELLGGALSEIQSDTPSAFSFADPSAEKRALTGGEAQEVYVRFSGYANSAFSYDAARGVYVKSQFGAPHTDENTGEALTFDNLLILFAKEEKHADGAQTNVCFAEGGDGWYICGGQREAVRWSKTASDAPLTLTLANGAPAVLNCGRTYVAVVDQTMAGYFQTSGAPAAPGESEPQEPSQEPSYSSLPAESDASASTDEPSADSNAPASGSAVPPAVPDTPAGGAPSDTSSAQSAGASSDSAA